MLPTIRLGSAEVSRLIVGGNPISGNSHVSAQADREMLDYFSAENIKRLLFHCQEQGINTTLLRMDAHILRIIREFRQDGGRMHWIAQTAPEMASLEGNIAAAMKLSPVAMYYHGTTADRLFKEGAYDELKRRLGVIRQTGLPVGLGTHMPELIRVAEEQQWDVDFYMAGVFNLSRQERISSAVTGISNRDEPFFEEDVPLMYERIRRTDKPCLAFKILGASRRCATQDSVRAAFAEAFGNIKKTDAVVVGMYPKDLDQPVLNCRYALQAIKEEP